MSGEISDIIRYQCPRCEKQHNVKSSKLKLPLNIKEIIEKGRYYVALNCPETGKSVRINFSRYNDLVSGNPAGVDKLNLDNYFFDWKEEDSSTASKEKDAAFRPKNAEEYLEEKGLLGEKYKTYKFNYKGRKGLFYFHKPGVKNKNKEEAGIGFVSTTMQDKASLERILAVKEKLTASWISKKQKNYKKKELKEETQKEIEKRALQEFKLERMKEYLEVEKEIKKQVRKNSAKYEEEFIKEFKQEYKELYGKIEANFEKEQINEAVKKSYLKKYNQIKTKYVSVKSLEKFKEKTKEDYERFKIDYSKENKESIEKKLFNNWIYQVPFHQTLTKDEAEWLDKREKERREKFKTEKENTYIDLKKEDREIIKAQLKSTLRSTPKRLLRRTLYYLIPGAGLYALGNSIYQTIKTIRSLKVSDAEADAYWKSLFNVPEGNLEDLEASISSSEAGIEESEDALDEMIKADDPNADTSNYTLDDYTAKKEELKSEKNAAAANETTQWNDIDTSDEQNLNGLDNWMAANGAVPVDTNGDGYTDYYQMPNGDKVYDPFDDETHGIIRGVDMPGDTYDEYEDSWDELQEAEAASANEDATTAAYNSYTAEYEEMVNFYSGKNTAEIALKNVNDAIFNQSILGVIFGGAVASIVLGLVLGNKKRKKLRKMSIGCKLGGIEDSEELQNLYRHEIKNINNNLVLKQEDDMNYLKSLKTKPVIEEEIVKKEIVDEIPGTLETLIEEKKNLSNNLNSVKQEVGGDSYEWYEYFLSRIKTDYYDAKKSLIGKDFEEEFLKLREAIGKSVEEDMDDYLSDAFVSKVLNNREDIKKETFVNELITQAQVYQTPDELFSFIEYYYLKSNDMKNYEKKLKELEGKIEKKRIIVEEKKKLKEEQEARKKEIEKLNNLKKKGREKIVELEKKMLNELQRDPLLISTQFYQNFGQEHHDKIAKLVETNLNDLDKASKKLQKYVKKVPMHELLTTIKAPITSEVRK